MTGVRPAIRIAAIVVGFIAMLSVLAAVRGRDGGESSQALSKDAYQAEIVSSSQRLVTTFQRFSSEAQTLAVSGNASSADRSETFKQLAVVAIDGATELRKFAVGLDGLTPPSDAVAATDMLVAGFNGFADDFAELGAALEEGSIADVTQLARELQALGTSEAGKSVQSAIAELEKTGYVFGATEEP